jgi:sec-independent protein translocase protein TatA
MLMDLSALAVAFGPPLLFLPTLGMGELAIVLVIVLLLFGPGKLPQAAKAMGEALRQFKQATGNTPPPPPSPPTTPDEQPPSP